MPPSFKQEIEGIKYNPAQDMQPEDAFAPVGDPNKCLRLPPSVQVYFIGTEKDCASLSKLVGQPFIGMDSEWRPTMTKFDQMRPALL